jgi:glycosyltransferase involved in cell wall biosynthesis
MPVGIDTDFFRRKLEIQKIPNSILFLGRISPIKKPDLLVEALNLLNKEGIDFKSLIVGEPLPKDKKYYEDIKNKISEYRLGDKIKLMGAIKNSETIDLYNKYEIFVNLTPSGSMDKTIFEAMACEMLVLISNKSLEEKINNKLIFKENNFNDLEGKLKDALILSATEKERLGKELRGYTIKEHDLALLVNKICDF